MCRAYRTAATVEPWTPPSGSRTLLARPEPEIPLDEAALLIAAHAHPALDVDARLARARRAGGRIAAGSRRGARRRRCSSTEGFAGNTDDYGDPRNSFLDDVLDRRLGIPITLSVLMLEVGRRRGVVLHGVGMPGHFLVGGEPGEWFDPFHDGARLDIGDCATVRGIASRDAASAPQFLRPVGPRAIVTADARSTCSTRSRDRDPNAGGVGRPPPAARPRRRAQRAGRRRPSVLGRLGQFAEAANEFDRLASRLTGDDAASRRRAAAATLARASCELSDAR